MLVAPLEDRFGAGRYRCGCAEEIMLRVPVVAVLPACCLFLHSALLFGCAAGGKSTGEGFSSSSDGGGFATSESSDDGGSGSSGGQFSNIGPGGGRSADGGYQ